MILYNTKILCTIGLNHEKQLCTKSDKIEVELGLTSGSALNITISLCFLIYLCNCLQLGEVSCP